MPRTTCSANAPVPLLCDVMRRETVGKSTRLPRLTEVQETRAAVQSAGDVKRVKSSAIGVTVKIDGELVE